MTPRRLRDVVACLVALAWLGVVAAQGGGLAYTVQIAALSDPESAIGQSGGLLRDGFPAYVVRAEGQAGTVFRVRVGAFGDRASADRYARVMGVRAGGTPRPALAEAIPAGILPLAPTAVARVSRDARAVLVPWAEDGVALRVGPADGPARYDLLGAGAPFDAYWARPSGEGAREEIAALPLDGEAGENDPPEVREALFRQRLRLVADRSGLSEEALADAVRGEPGGRELIAWRGTDADDAIHGVLAAGASPRDRAEDAWLGEAPPDRREPLYVVAGGEAATAAADGEAPEGPEGVDAIADAPSDAPAQADVDDTSAGAEGGADEAAAAGPDEPAGDADGADSGDVGEEAAAPDAAADDAPADAGSDDAAAEDAGVDPASGGADAGVEPAAAPPARAAGTVGDETWSAFADGGWTLLQVGDVTWRALVGAPRAGVRDLLVLEVEEAFEIVRLVPR